ARARSGTPSSEDRQGMGRRARAADESKRRRGEEKLVAPFLATGDGEALRIGVVDQSQPEKRDRQMHPHTEASVADRPFVHHLPGERGVVFVAEPLET